MLYVQLSNLKDQASLTSLQRYRLFFKNLCYRWPPAPHSSKPRLTVYGWSQVGRDKSKLSKSPFKTGNGHCNCQ